MGCPDDPDNRLGSMPLTVRRVALVFDRPFVSAGRDGTTPDTTLRGALFEALLRVGCTRGGACAGTREGHPCAAPGDCPLGWLYQPVCPHQNGRNHRSPIGVTIDATHDASGRVWSVVLQHWGSHACALEAVVMRALERAGRTGLRHAHGVVGFRCRWQAPERGVLADYCRLPNPVPRRAELVFVTPCQSSATRLDRLLGNTAHDLMQWRLVDTGESADLFKYGCDDLADAVREEAAASLAGVTVRWREHGNQSIGRRQSRTNRGAFVLEGFTGRAVLSGSLADCWPWLALFSARGAGGRGGFGMGRVVLSAGDGRD